MGYILSRFAKLKVKYENYVQDDFLGLAYGVRELNVTFTVMGDTKEQVREDGSEVDFGPVEMSGRPWL